MVRYRNYQEDGVIAECPSSELSIEPDADGHGQSAKSVL
jgi:hypothetical protein